MIKHLFTTLTFWGLLIHSGKCQTIDTLVDVGGYRLQFQITKGTGMPILFETGSGGDGSDWDPIIKQIAELTHATLITYGRSGFGKSELDSSNHDINKHGILHGMKGLETALKKLGYNGNIMVVGLSYGGFYATLYASRHPDLVKAAVLIDANHVCWFTDAYVAAEMIERRSDSTFIKSNNWAMYYQSLNLQNTVELMKKSPFPATIPVIDLVSEKNFPDSVRATRWKDCHKQFAAAQPNRVGITAHGCGHVIFRDNPSLVINAIVKEYAGAQSAAQANEIMKRFLSYSLEEVNHPPASTK